MKLDTIYQVLSEKGYSDVEIPEITLLMTYSEFENFRNNTGVDSQNHKLGLTVEELLATGLNFRLYPPLKRKDLIARIYIETEEATQLPRHMWDEFSDEEVQDAYAKIFHTNDGS